MKTAVPAAPPVLSSARLGVSLALLTGGGLLFEIALTRLLSVLFFSTYSYLVLSIAVLGLAAGAALASLSGGAREPRNWPFWASLAGLAGVVLTLYALSGEASGLRFVLLALTVLPYLFTGVTVTAIFARHPEASPRLYLADLAGAGAGALLALPLIDLLGGPGGMLAAALALALAALLLAPRSLGSLLTALLVAATLVMHASGGGPRLALETLATPKPIRETLQQGATVAETRWNAFARTDLVHFQERDRYLIYLDGGAGSVVPDASRPETWLGDIGSLAFAVEPPESAFLVGSGGGLDIALARNFGSRRIVAAEINEAAVELTRGLEEHAGDLYGAGTELLIDDGRSALRRLGGEFDLILLSQVVSGVAEARGLALVENGLYTVEAFSTYLEHLAPEGRVALKLYDELTLTRAMATALAALQRRGASLPEAARHLFAALDTSARPPVPLLIVNGTQLDRSQAISWARTAEDRNFALLYVPGLLGPPQLERILSGEAGLEALTESGGGIDLRPTTDERPFFYQFERGLPRALRPLAWSLGALLVILLLLVVSAQLRQGRERLLAPPMVAALGAGFMLVEIGVLQRAQLLIGHPTLTLATVLAVMLLGAACGSGLAGRCPPGREHRWVAAAGVVATLLILGFSLAWPPASSSISSFPAAGAAAGTALMVLPLAVSLGFPFPLLLRSLGRHGPAQVAAAWTVNGVSSVAGAVGATALAIAWGFDTVSLAAAASYLLLALLAGVLALRS